MGTDPLVSVVMITYGHEKFINEAIQGVLNQEIEYDIELIISNDCSPDRTDEVVQSILKNHSKPCRIRYIKQEKNIGMMPNFISALKEAKGKFVALCEGDDYWINPLKLQKQVDLLQQNPEFALCVGGFKNYHENSQKEENIIKIPKGVKRNLEGYEFTLDELKNGWITKTLTATFRNLEQITSQISAYQNGRDINLFYQLLKNGEKGFYFTEIMGVYRLHQGGVNSMQGSEFNTNAAYNIYKELHQVNKDEFTRHMYIRSTLSLLNYNLSRKYLGNTKNIKLIYEAFFLIRTGKEILLMLSAFLPKKLKSSFLHRVNLSNISLSS